MGSKPPVKCRQNVKKKKKGGFNISVQVTLMQGLDWEILWDFLHDHTCTVVTVWSRLPQAMLFLFLTCYREVRSCYQLLWFRGTGDANLVPWNPPRLNGDSGWNLLVAVMWCSTRSWQKQSTPSLCSVTAGVDTEKPCSLNRGREDASASWIAPYLKTQPNICWVILLSLGVGTEKPGISRCDCLYYFFVHERNRF